MLSPEYLQKITESTEQKVAEINTYLTAKIVKRIIKLYEETGEVKLIPSSLYDIKKQQSAGRLLEEIQQEIEWLLPDIKEEICKAFYDAGAKIANDVNATIGEIIRIEHEKGNLQNIDVPQFKEKEKANRISDLNMTEKEIRFLESAYRRTEGELYNLTGTTASRAQSVFIEACDTAYFKATHGVSMNTAIIDAIKEVSKKGVTTVHYASGREDKIEVAIARAVRTGVNRANGDITLTRCAEAGVNYVVVSSHLGARVTPYEDYRTHADWQGQVYQLDWTSPELKKYVPKENEKLDGKFGFLNEMKAAIDSQMESQYRDFIKTCGYGKMLGICGINCRHSFGLFYPGISVNNKIQFEKEENKRRYENEQKQRSMERSIRKTKRELNVLETSGIDTEECVSRRKLLEKRLERQDDEYKDFCKKYGLKPVNYRLQVAKTKGVDNEGVVSINETYADIKFKSQKPSKEVQNDRATIIKSYNDLPLKIQSKMQDVTFNLGCSGSRCDYINGIIDVAMNAEKQDIDHEFGHLIEYRVIDKEKVEEYKQFLIEGLTALDVYPEKYYNDAGDEMEAIIVHGPKFVSEYQGRIYVSSVKDAFNEDGSIRTELMLEVVSESFRMYQNEKEKLSEHTEAVELIEGAIQ